MQFITIELHKRFQEKLSHLHTNKWIGKKYVKY